MEASQAPLAPARGAIFISEEPASSGAGPALSPGAIAGIVVGGFCLLVLLVMFGIWTVLQRRNRAASSSAGKAAQLSDVSTGEDESKTKVSRDVLTPR